MLGATLALIDNKDDKQQYTDLYLKYKNYLYKISFSVLHNCAQAEEAVSETFLKAAINFDKIKLQPSPKITSYLVILCRNISINMYNKNKREYGEDIFDVADAVEKTADVDFFEKFDTQLVVEKLKKLPPIYYDTLYFEIVWEYSADEIAKLLNVGVEAVYKRSQRGKKMMRTMLEKEDNENE